MSGVTRTFTRFYKTVQSIKARKLILTAPDTVPKSILISGGAAASTSTLALLAPFGWNSPVDRDGLKHLPVFGELRSLSEQVRVVFILREEKTCVESLHARGYCRHQALKLSLSVSEKIAVILMGHKPMHLWLQRALERQARSFILAAKQYDSVCVLSFHDLIARHWNDTIVFTSSEKLALDSLESVRLESRRL